MSYTYAYPRPAVTVDIAIFRKHEILLIRRKNEPFKNAWALPGGFVDENEPLHTAAHRELLEETSHSGIELAQFKTYGNPGRDPRGHTVSVVYYGYADENANPIAADDALLLEWHSMYEIPEMAFDHGTILTELFNRFFELPY